MNKYNTGHKFFINTKNSQYSNRRARAEGTGFKNIQRRVSINYNKQNRRHLQQTHVQGLGHPAEQSHLLATLVLVGLGRAHVSSVTIFSGAGIIMVADLALVIELRDGQRSLEPGQNRN